MPVSIECKAKAKLALMAMYDQAKVNAPNRTEPLLFVKADRCRPLAVVDAEYFLDLMKGRHGNG